MKTLVFNGSTKKNGDTEALLRVFLEGLGGEVRIFSHESGIGPCRDCRYCWEREGCAIADGMEEVYPFLRECDNIVLASPIWFSSLSGPLLNLCSRLQTLFAARAFRKKPVEMKQKNGVILLAGGQRGTEIVPLKSAFAILSLVNTAPENVIQVCSMDTDRLPAEKDREALAKCREAAEILNRRYEEKSGKLEEKK